MVFHFTARQFRIPHSEFRIKLAEEFNRFADVEVGAVVAGGEVVVAGGELGADGAAPVGGNLFGNDKAHFVGAGEVEGGSEFGGGGDVVEGLAKLGGGFDGAVGFNGKPVAACFESLCEVKEVRLKEGFAAGKDDVLAGEGGDALEELVEGEVHLGGEVGVAPGAGEVATREANEDAGFAGVGAFALEGLKDFVEGKHSVSGGQRVLRRRACGGRRGLGGSGCRTRGG